MSLSGLNTGGSPTAVGDTVEARVRVGTNGHALTLRDFTLKIKRIA